jgi:hypothetical protein
MTSPQTPKFSGPHRRWGRPFGQLSTVHSVVAVGLVVIVCVIFVVLVRVMMH